VNLYKTIRLKRCRLPAGGRRAENPRRPKESCYRVRLWVLDGPTSTDSIVRKDDYSALRAFRGRLNRHLFSGVRGCSSSTLSAIARWIFFELYPQLPSLARVDIENAGARGYSYMGPTGLSSLFQLFHVFPAQAHTGEANAP